MLEMSLEVGRILTGEIRMGIMWLYVLAISLGFCADSKLSYHQSSTEAGISFHSNTIHHPLKYTVLKATRLQSKSVLFFRRHKQKGRK